MAKSNLIQTLITTNVIPVTEVGNMPLLSYCIDEFLEFKRAQRLSRWTLLDYETVLRRFNREIGDFDIDHIERKTIAHYLASLDLSKKESKTFTQLFLLSGHGRLKWDIAQFILFVRSSPPNLKSALFSPFYPCSNYEYACIYRCLKGIHSSGKTCLS